jgi:phosphate transport system substrate-binding protein
MDGLVAAYLADRLTVTIQQERAVNAERTLQALAAGHSDIASVSWLPEGVAAEGALWYRPFARDSIVIITHSTNPIGGLTLPQLRDLFQGQILSWAELGGLDLDIVPVSRENGAGTRLSFELLVMGKQSVSTTSVVMPSSEAVVQFVASTPGAIGYVSSTWLSPAVNILSLEGVLPSSVSVQDGRYLLARPFYLVAPAEPGAGLAEFVEWIRGGEGREIIERSYALAP